MKYALLFGLNYNHVPDARLRGCVNDVLNMKARLQSPGYDFASENVRVCTDDSVQTRKSCTAQGILQEINNAAVMSWSRARQCPSDPMALCVIHFSGHGCQIRDVSHDERDGKDECLVPTDFKTAGVLPDDLLKQCLRNFHPDTKVVFFSDCCHSGTIGDLKYRYVLTPGTQQVRIQTENYRNPCDADVLLISGCRDTQTSADAWNVQKRRKFTGAMTSCLLSTLDELGAEANLHAVLTGLRRRLREKRFTQVPQLTSSVYMSDLTKIKLF